MKYRYIFVDLDNTLLDFEAAEEYSFYYTAQSRGLSFGEAELERYQDALTPAIILIPGKEGSLGIGMDNVKKFVERAVGADIL